MFRVPSGSVRSRHETGLTGSPPVDLPLADERPERRKIPYTSLIELDECRCYVFCFGTFHREISLIQDLCAKAPAGRSAPLDKLDENGRRQHAASFQLLFSDGMLGWPEHAGAATSRRLPSLRL